MKKKPFLTIALVLPLSMQAYKIQNNSDQDVKVSYNYEHNNVHGIQVNKGSGRSEYATHYYHGSKRHGKPHILNVTISTIGDDGVAVKTVIDLRPYSDEQIKRQNNPVIFTLNRDLTVTASEEGANKPASHPAAPPAPKPQTEQKLIRDKTITELTNVEIADEMQAIKDQYLKKEMEMPKIVANRYKALREEARRRLQEKYSDVDEKSETGRAAGAGSNASSSSAGSGSTISSNQ